MFDWIMHNKGLFLTSYTEIGGNHQHAVELQTQHNHFAMNCMVRRGLCLSCTRSHMADVVTNHHHYCHSQKQAEPPPHLPSVPPQNMRLLFFFAAFVLGRHPPLVSLPLSCFPRHLGFAQSVMSLCRAAPTIDPYYLPAPPSAVCCPLLPPLPHCDPCSCAADFTQYDTDASLSHRPICASRYLVFI